MNNGLRGILVSLALGLVGCAPPEARLSLARRELALEHLGAAIARSAPGAKVLVVGNPFTRAPGAEPGIRDTEEASVRGLTRGIGQGATLLGVDHPELKPGAIEDPRSFPIPAGITTPISFLTVSGAWDRVAARHESAGVLVSLIGFPEDVAQTRAWTDSAGPRWALYDPDFRLLGPAQAVRTAFEEGRLLAVVLNRPGAPPESEPLATEGPAEFDRRYLLVTKENVDKMMAAWPGLFP